MCEMFSEEINVKEEKLPPDIEEALMEAEERLLPQKSRLIYEREYQSFKKWESTNKITGMSEKVLLAYFSEKSKQVKPSSLWSYYSMLKRTLLIIQNFDISKFGKLINLMKNLSDGYKGKKFIILEADDIKFLTQAPDDVYLFMKVRVL
ncbi:hypothetical protein QE152_g32564 [Popillia japonica]|uniref:Uncharacterized protein n=1 Tax=Popillia japonica TaxID=7064 RepID=A0AAW1IYK9_POPJA